MSLVNILLEIAGEKGLQVAYLRALTSAGDISTLSSTPTPQHSPRGVYARSSLGQLRIIPRRDSSASPLSTRQDATVEGNNLAIVNASPTTEEAESSSLQVEKAFGFTARANMLISTGLHNCSEWNEVRDLYFNAAAHFQIAGLHYEAGEAFSNAAAISRVYGNTLEVATAASYAIDSFKFADPMQAIELLKETLQIHHEGQRPNLEAKAAKDIAELYEALGELPEALNHYSHASALYQKQEITRDFYLKTLGKVARISADLGHYQDAIDAFVKLAESATRGTRVTDKYMYALLCRAAEASGDRRAHVIAKLKSTFDGYQDVDEHFQKGVEHAFIKGVIAAWDKGSLAMFDAAHTRYVEYRGSDDWTERLIAKIRSNLHEYVLPYM